MKANYIIHFPNLPTRSSGWAKGRFFYRQAWFVLMAARRAHL